MQFFLLFKKISIVKSFRSSKSVWYTKQHEKLCRLIGVKNVIKCLTDPSGENNFKRGQQIVAPRKAKPTRF